MVLESLIPVKSAERRPIEMLPLSILYASIGVLLALWIFPDNASLAVVFFTIMSLLPLMLHMTQFEEAKDEYGSIDIRKHRRVIPFFVYMFLGLVIAYALWAILLPYQTFNAVFQMQISAIEQINAPSGAVISGELLGPMGAILSNNLRVLAFSILFSFIYGAGAIFILTWNASVISVAIGNGVRNFVSSVASTGGALGVAAYFHGFGLALARYMIHGIPEILGYFIGGLAGGILSVAIIRHRLESRIFRRAFLDAFDLTLLAIFILFIAAILEVSVSPWVPLNI